MKTAIIILILLFTTSAIALEGNPEIPAGMVAIDLILEASPDMEYIGIGPPAGGLDDRPYATGTRRVVGLAAAVPIGDRATFRASWTRIESDVHGVKESATENRFGVRFRLYVSGER